MKLLTNWNVLDYEEIYLMYLLHDRASFENINPLGTSLWLFLKFNKLIMQKTIVWIHESYTNLCLYKKAYGLTITMHTLVHRQREAFIDGNFEQVLTKCRVNTLWHSDAIWLHRIESTLPQVLACCLTPPSHYLNQCWVVITEALWHSLGKKFTSCWRHHSTYWV